MKTSYPLQHRLSAEGYNTLISPNGANMMGIIIQTPPDLVLLDIYMKGVDGGTICQLLKSSNSTAKIPILMFFANENVGQITEQCGADGYIKKPFDTENFKRTFQHILGKG